MYVVSYLKMQNGIQPILHDGSKSSRVFITKRNNYE